MVGRTATTRIALINMPFAAVDHPSIALTQLKAVALGAFPSRLEIDLHYLNHDFAHLLTRVTYNRISESVKLTSAGFGDWLFQPFAFPGVAADPTAYLQRYNSTLGEARDLLEAHQSLRERLDEGLDAAIESRGLQDYPVVGFTTMFAQTAASIALARRIKQRNPDSVILVGGANCETSMGGVLVRNVDVIDLVFSGPSLESFRHVIGHLLDGNPERCEEVTGVLSRNKIRRLGRAASAEIGDELDVNTPLDLDFDDYLASAAERCPDAQPALLFETSRGCWWGERSHCTFCGLNGMTMKYRAMEPDRALDQFARLFRYWPRVRRFKSVDNILPRSYLKKVLPAMQTPEGASLFYEVKSDLKDHEVQTLAAAGVTEIQPGIEALATSTLHLMGKGTSACQNLQLLRSCMFHGVNPLWNLLVGFPGEAESVYQEYDRVIPSLVHFPPPGGVFPVRFDRYSPYHKSPDKFDLRLAPYDFYRMVYPFSDADLEQFAYFFSDQNYSNAYHSSTARWLSRLTRRVDEWNERWQVRASAPQLVFEWRGDVEIVYDTRFGPPLEHLLSPPEIALLRALARPQPRRRILDGSLNEALPGLDPERALAQLTDLALLFEDEGRLMSLVLEPEREQGLL